MPDPDIQLAATIFEKFVARTDVKAVQSPDGKYRPVHGDFTIADVADHLAGRQTYGHYVLDADSTCRVITFDCDLRKSGFWVRTPTAKEVEAIDDIAREHGDEFASVVFGQLDMMNYTPVEGNLRELWLDTANRDLREALKLQMRTLIEVLTSRIHQSLEIPVAAAYSGSKGVHVYAFLPEKLHGDEARLIANDVLESFGYFAPTRAENFWTDTRTGTDSFSNFEIEVFPKQDELDEGKIGNLVRLPMGKNRKSRHPAFFVDQSAAHVALKPHPDPLRLLETGNPWQ